MERRENRRGGNGESQREDENEKGRLSAGPLNLREAIM